MKKISFVFVLGFVLLFIACGDDKKEETTQNSTKDVQKVVKTVEKKTAPIVAEKTGKELYTTCVSCHGQKANLKAFGVSHVIKDWDKEKLVSAMKGYKAKTYGGKMKGIMQVQLMKLNDTQIEKIADYITTLN